MKNYVPAFCVALFLTSALFAQRFEDINPNRRYDEVAWLITHNANNNGTDGPGFICFGGRNQANGIRRQLEDGVRSFMVDLYQVNGEYRLKHGPPNMCMMDAERFNFILSDWLENHPQDIVTLHVEAGANMRLPDFENVFLGRRAGYRDLGSYIYNHPEFESASRPRGSDGDVYPTINDMLTQGKQLVIFVEKDLRSDLFRYEFAHTVQNQFSANQVTQLYEVDKFTRHRGVDEKTILTVNHFAVDSPFGTGDRNKSRDANQSVREKAITAWWQFGRKPSIAVDYYNLSYGRGTLSQIGEVNRINEVRGKFSMPGNPDGRIRDVRAYFAELRDGTWQRTTEVNYRGQRSVWHKFYSVPAAPNDRRAVVFEHPDYTFSPALIELDQYGGDQSQTTVLNVSVERKGINDLSSPLKGNGRFLSAQQVEGAVPSAAEQGAKTYTLYTIMGARQATVNAATLKEAYFAWRSSGTYRGIYLIVEENTLSGRVQTHKRLF